jgi:CheY-like chemotaxis protein
LKRGAEIKKIPEQIGQNDFSGLHLLLVEDDKTNQMFMKVILKKLKINYEIANDGLEAIEKFKNTQYDIILMDENMPNMNGIIATKEIIQIEKEKNLKHTPIIALTANALKGDREKFLEAGMDEYLTKPLDKNILIKMLGIYRS